MDWFLALLLLTALWKLRGLRKAQRQARLALREAAEALSRTEFSVTIRHVPDAPAQGPEAPRSPHA